jgi:hypothetical protein
MHFRPEARLRKLPIDLARIESAKGLWLVAVDSVAETIAGTTLLVGITLEQTLDDQSFQVRRLEAMFDCNAAREPENGEELLDRIRKWIESTDGDGFLDLTKTFI